MDILFGGNVLTLIESIGLFGVLGIVFAESGLFFGFFLPGDSLLFTAGLLASQGVLSVYFLVPLAALAAIAGDSVGYWFGRKIGPVLFDKEDSFFFKKSHVHKTQAFYVKYGPKALILGRFIPIVRTFVPILAGVGDMKYGLFLRYNIIGGLLWTVGLTLGGYTLGHVIPDVDKYLLPIILAIIVVSFLPIAIEVVKGRRENKKPH